MSKLTIPNLAVEVAPGGATQAVLHAPGAYAVIIIIFTTGPAS